MRLPLDYIQTFATIASCGSMREAATALGIQPSTVTTHLKALEKQVGVKLISRSTRRIALTEAGEDLYKSVLPGLDQIAAALRKTQENEGIQKGRIRASIPDFAWGLFFRPRIASFKQKYPGIDLEWSLSDRLVDVESESVDIGVRLGDRLDDTVIAKPITAPLETALFASPEYLDRHGTPRQPGDLFAHKAVRYRFHGSGKLAPWELQGKDGRQLVDVKPTLVVDSLGAMIDSVVDGVGIGYTFHDCVIDHIKLGRLRELLPKTRRTFPPLYVYYPTERRGSEILNAYVEHFSI